ncbi:MULTISPECIES: hypothetical protein [unclassified Streptomyces]|uniref:hypothetical protein n=1 Tax=unclassified Streptomyces TaxID=2593676 RepID=UPI0023664790|nr:MULTISPECIES: hypothetical protein [unclassified Streptomyces]MDF3142985.1 hypothetical protein [Streptomyces sp. T21Q-yed]WDF43375.1 hypothetical protein PBV52_44635 [Streptomyces sp. T12]
MAIITAALGLSMAAAGPASAADGVGTWVHYGNTNPITSSASTWRCGPTQTVEETGMVAQVCAIRSASGNSAQAAVIVRNNLGTSQSTDAWMRLRNSADSSIAGTWDCDSTGVAANSWKVCFGETLYPKLASVYARGFAGIEILERSPDV